MVRPPQLRNVYDQGAPQDQQKENTAEMKGGMHRGCIPTDRMHRKKANWRTLSSALAPLVIDRIPRRHVR